MLCFALVTQLQFNRLNNEKIEATRMETYNSDMRAYETALNAREDCLRMIAVRETYRGIFAGVEDMFLVAADLPVELLPNDPEALAYQQRMTESVAELITEPVTSGLPPRTAADCPDVPVEPERP